MDVCDGHISKKLFAELVCGRHAASPFEAQVVEASRKKVLGIVASAGFDGARLSGDQESLVEFRLISALLEVSGDPDDFIEHILDLVPVFSSWLWILRESHATCFLLVTASQNRTHLSAEHRNPPCCCRHPPGAC